MFILVGFFALIALTTLGWDNQKEYLDTPHGSNSKKISEALQSYFLKQDSFSFCDEKGIVKCTTYSFRQIAQILDIQLEKGCDVPFIEDGGSVTINPRNIELKVYNSGCTKEVK